MHENRIRCLLVALAVVSAAGISASAARAGADLGIAPRLACRGVLSFGDALALPVSMTVDRERSEVTMPECRKFPHLAGFCAGTLLKLRDHQFVFDGFESSQNSKLWATLDRLGAAPGAGVAEPGIQAMRVLFLGRCAPTDRRALRPARVLRTP